MHGWKSFFWRVNGWEVVLTGVPWERDFPVGCMEYVYKHGACAEGRTVLSRACVCNQKVLQGMEHGKANYQGVLYLYLSDSLATEGKLGLGGNVWPGLKSSIQQQQQNNFL